MARRFLCCLSFSAMMACAIGSSAQAAAAAAGNSDPRHFDATQFGQRNELGTNWLFAPGDNPAWASPAFDAAQAFGQDDDITVLTLSYAGVPAIALTPLAPQ